MDLSNLGIAYRALGRADIASGGTRSRNQTAVRSDLDSVIWAAHGRDSAAWA